MHVAGIVQELLGSSIYKTRIKTLSILIKGVVRSKELKLTSLGRHIEIEGIEIPIILIAIQKDNWGILYE